EFAAMRYTEMKMSKIGEEMLKDIGKNTIDFRDNYDGTRKEPIVLPSPIPQILLGGSLGIAVGMATNIPPHNLSEVCDALIYLVDNPDVNTEDLFKFIKGPDFPTGGAIFGQKEIISAYSQGKGAVASRGKAEIIETEKRGTQIIITEIPFRVHKSNLVKQLALLVKDKKIEGIRDIRDESDRDGLRIAIDLSRNAFPKKVLNQLYKWTDLQKVFHLNMLALVDGKQPKLLSLVEFLNYFLAHKKEVVLRRIKFDLEKAKEREHILEGLHRCLSKIDEVIKVIKKSADAKEAEQNLIKKFKLTKIQAQAILETKLAALAKLERGKIEKELKELKARIKELTLILKSPKKIKEIIKKEFKEIKERFGDERRTKVFVQKIGEFNQEDLIPDDDVIITLTSGGYVKRVSPLIYKKQKRGGKGMLGMKTMGDDVVEYFLSARAHDFLLFFTDSGKVFQTKAYEIPEGSRVAKGRGLVNFLEISPQEKVLSLQTLGKKDKEGLEYLIMVTQNGIIKKTPLKAFENIRRNGLIAIGLKKGDLLKDVRKTSGNDEILLVTKKGQSIRFKEKEIRSMGRTATGIKGIRLKKDDKVISMQIIKEQKPKSKEYLMIITENGYGKKTDLKQYRLQGRGGSGIKTANVTPKTGDLVGAKVLTGEEEDLIVVSQKGQVIRMKIKAVSEIGRSTQGVRLMRLDAGNKVASVTCI
ncbi:MAG TPA: DNA gyrase subunit A, partial [bacterium]|nr:DNA gyrase subunit A [bacterium]